MAKFVSRQLAQFVGKTDSYVKDSRHFIELIGRVQLSTEDILVSFDVESLFTKVPITETVKLIGEILSSELADMAELCLRSTYFLFDGKFYEQTDGAAMGSPLSPVAANLYMESFEKAALEEATLKPKAWLRYVDDVWAVWPHGRDSLNEFLEHLNSIHANIKFTMEVEKNGQLPFLDVMTTRKPNGTIGRSVYRKPTHTNRYLNANSHHHPAQKSGVLNTLINRAIRISDAESFKKEEKQLRSSLKQNGYSSFQINSVFKKQLQRHEQQVMGPVRDEVPVEEDVGVKRAYLPFVKGTTDKIGRVLRKHNIKTVFKPSSKVRDFLRPVKDKIPLSTPGVYEIPCSCGSVYIGETKRLISTRLKEHIRDTKNEDPKSAVAEHSLVSRHGIMFDKTKVLAKAPYYYPRIIRESIEISKQENNFNRDDGFKLPKAWQPVINKIKSMHN